MRPRRIQPFAPPGLRTHEMAMRRVPSPLLVLPGRFLGCVVEAELLSVQCGERWSLQEPQTRRLGSVIRKADVVLTVGCAVALGLSAAGALRPGAPARVRIDAWFRARATQKVLRKEWAALAASPNRLGAAEHEVNAVLFVDFECPYCAALWPRLDSLLVTHPDAAVVIRHLPLSFHGAAEGAARAAICAGEEGRFAEMAAALFAHDDWHADRDWSREAEAAGVPAMGSFNACLQAPATSRRLAEDSTFARALGISGTPALVLQDRVVPGLLNYAQLDQILGIGGVRAR